VEERHARLLVREREREKLGCAVLLTERDGTGLMMGKRGWVTGVTVAIEGETRLVILAILAIVKPLLWKEPLLPFAPTKRQLQPPQPRRQAAAVGKKGRQGKGTATATRRRPGWWDLFTRSLCWILR